MKSRNISSYVLAVCIVFITFFAPISHSVAGDISAAGQDCIVNMDIEKSNETPIMDNCIQTCIIMTSCSAGTGILFEDTNIHNTVVYIKSTYLMNANNRLASFHTETPLRPPQI